MARGRAVFRFGPWAAALVLAVAGVRPSRAEDPPPEPPKQPQAAPADVAPRFTALLARYKSAIEARDRSTRVALLRPLILAAAEATADPKDEAATKGLAEVRKTAQAVLRRALATRDFEVVLAALDGYATLRIPGSSADLKPFADRQLSEKRPPPVRLAAIGAWAAIHDPGTHETLLEHIRLPQTDATKADVALAAARGLASYEPAKGGPRYEMLRDFMQTFDAIFNSTTYTASPARSHWFTLLAPTMVATFNALARAGVTSYPSAVEWWRDNRRKVQAGTE